MWEKINNFLKGQIVTSIIYIALGACLVYMPVSTVNVICKFVFGILLILVGLYHILIYVAEKLNSTIFDLFSGGVLMVLGISATISPVALLRENIIDIIILMIFTVLVWLFAGTKRKISRKEGIIMALTYLVYCGYIIIR